VVFSSEHFFLNLFHQRTGSYLWDEADEPIFVFWLSNVLGKNCNCTRNLHFNSHLSSSVLSSSSRRKFLSGQRPRDRIGRSWNNLSHEISHPSTLLCLGWGHWKYTLCYGPDWFMRFYWNDRCWSKVSLKYPGAMKNKCSYGKSTSPCQLQWFIAGFAANY
jgi:hypothetical protein